MKKGDFVRFKIKYGAYMNGVEGSGIIQEVKTGGVIVDGVYIRL